MFRAEKRLVGRRLEVWVEDVVAQVGAVEFENAQTEEKQEEPAIVALAEAVVDPGTVVVESGDAGVAERAVLAAGWFGDIACAAGLGWAVEDVVVRILMRVLGLWSEVVIRVGGAEICEDVGQSD